MESKGAIILYDKKIEKGSFLFWLQITARSQLVTNDSL